ELSLDDTTDQHTLDNLEKELQVLRSLAGCIHFFFLSSMKNNHVKELGE
ncbi:ZBBX isoform 14, partial [Pan troglodytes]